MRPVPRYRILCRCSKVFYDPSRARRLCPSCRAERYQNRLANNRSPKIKTPVRRGALRVPIEFAQDFVLALPEMRREYLRQISHDPQMPRHYSGINLGELPSFRK